MTDTINRFKPLGKTKIVKGSILTPENGGLRFILSINNMIGKPEGNPLLPVLDKKWKKVREETKGWFANKTGAYKLGAINTTAVQSDIWVIHMLCQNDKLDVDTAGLEDCLKKVATSAKYEKASLHISTLLLDAIPDLKNLVHTHCVLNGISVIYYDELQ